jgi:hypothetical protein
MTNQPQATEEFRLLQADFAMLRREISEVKFERDGLREENRALRHQLKVIRGSISWRLTRPLRGFRQSLRDRRSN